MHLSARSHIAVSHVRCLDHKMVEEDSEQTNILYTKFSSHHIGWMINANLLPNISAPLIRMKLDIPKDVPLLS